MSRIFDIAISAVLLILTLPILLAAGAGIKLFSPGPIFYLASRAGKGGKPFAMYKFRTMHVRKEAGSEITAPGDQRIFPLGQFLRKVKIDEMPQFINVLRGEMAIVGPRPEAVIIVERDYQPWMKETLSVTPGVTSPGAIFGYTHVDNLLSDEDPERSYRENVLEPKLALEMAYIARRTWLSDLGVMWRTAVVIARISLGERDFPLPIEHVAAGQWFDFSVLKQESQ